MDAAAATANEAARPGVTTREWGLLALVVVAGAVLRCWGLGSLEVEHFDEGVYASNLWFDAGAGGYPARFLYAPPLLPALIEWSMILAGPSPLAPFWPGLLLGIATPVVVWGVGRAGWGPAAGLAAATLAAGSDFHALFSRSALTDVPTTLAIVAAVGVFSQAVRRQRLDLAAWAGGLTALAWWTKYNGWLPLAITGAGLAGWLVVRRPARGDALVAGKYWLVMAGVAVLGWGPCLWSLQKDGGYAAVSANHAQYVDGWSHWPANAQRQLANIRALEGLPAAWSPLCAVCVVLALSPSFTCNPPRAQFTQKPADPRSRRRAAIRLGLLLTALGAAGRFGGGTNACAALLAFTLLRFLIHEVAVRRSGSTADAPESAWPGWWLCAWVVGLAAAIPMYRPYARLVLPELAAVWLGAGVALASLASSLRRRDEEPTDPEGATWSRTDGLAAIGAGVMLVVFTWNSGGLSPRPARLFPTAVSRAGLAGAVAEVVAPSGPRSPPASREAVIYVYAEPAAFFTLRRDGWTALAAGGLGFAEAPPPPIPVYLLTGPHAERDPGFAREWERVGARFAPVAEAGYQASDLVRLDEPSVDPAAVAQQPSETLKLWRLK